MSSVVEHTTDLNGGERMLRGTYKNRMVLGDVGKEVRPDGGRTRTDNSGSSFDRSLLG